MIPWAHRGGRDATEETGEERIGDHLDILLAESPRIAHDVGALRKSDPARVTIEPVIGHCKIVGHLGRDFLKGRRGNRINAVMSAVGSNPRLILKWLRKLWRKIIAAIWAATTPPSALKPAA